MKEQDILDHLRQKIEDVPVPFEEADWNAMQSMLDRQERKKIIAFTPSYKTWGAIGIAAAVLLAGIFILNYLHKEPLKQQDVVLQKSKQNSSFLPSEKKNNQQQAADTGVIITPLATAAERTLKSIQKSVLPLENAMQGQGNELPMVTTSEENIVRTDPPTTDVPPVTIADEKRKPVQKIDFSEFEEKKVSGRERLYFIAGGGVLTGDRNVGYSLSTAVVKGLSPKLSLQAGVAYVYNDLKRDINQMTITSRTVIGVGGPEIEYDTTFARVNSKLPQNYAQAEVSLNLSLLKNSNLLMGIDVQRLMRSKEEVDAINNILANEQQIPLWNSGVKLRYQYSVIKNLALGLAYRFDVSSTIGNKLPNNFTQAYIIYQFKK